MDDIPTEKAALRAWAKAVRDGLDAKTRRTLTKRAVTRLAGLSQVLEASTIALYCAINSEMDPSSLLDCVALTNKRFVWPRTNTIDKRLTFHTAGMSLSHSSALSRHFSQGPFGVPEPLGEEVPLSHVDALVVPGLAFDVRGNRLGYGGGYYDRTLDDANIGFVVGLTFDELVVATLPTEETDQRVDCIITPEQRLLRAPTT